MNNIVSMLIGAGVGAAITYFVTKRINDKKIEEIINDYEEIINDYEEIDDHETQDTELVFPDDFLSNNKENIKVDDNENIINEKNIDEVEDSDFHTEEPNYNYNPYIITPDEYGEYADYNLIDLLYFADDVLTDDQEELLDDDIMYIIGEDALRNIGKYEKDVVHVRNDELCCDYEIMRCARKYYDTRK